MSFSEQSSSADLFIFVDKTGSGRSNKLRKYGYALLHIVVYHYEIIILMVRGESQQLHACQQEVFM